MSAAENAGEPLASTTANPDRSAASVALSGLAAHPVVAASRDADTDEAKAAAVLRWLARDFDICLTADDAAKVDALADEIDPTKETTT